jgi:hypothetical protein
VPSCLRRGPNRRVFSVFHQKCTTPEIHSDGRQARRRLYSLGNFRPRIASKSYPIKIVFTLRERLRGCLHASLPYSTDISDMSDYRVAKGKQSGSLGSPERTSPASIRATDWPESQHRRFPPHPWASPDCIMGWHDYEPSVKYTDPPVRYAEVRYDLTRSNVRGGCFHVFTDAYQVRITCM